MVNKSDIEYFNKLLSISAVPKNYFYVSPASLWDAIKEDNGFSREKAIVYSLKHIQDEK